MRGVLAVVALVVTTLLLVVWAVAGLGDRGTLVPAPHRVAEEFVRALLAERTEAALSHLSHAREAELARPTEDLKEHLATLGDVRSVEGIQDGPADSSAHVHVTVETRDAGHRIHIALVREHGLWKIAGFTPAIARSHVTHGRRDPARGTTG